MNGWERLWVFVGIFWISLAAMVGYWGLWTFDDFTPWNGITRFVVMTLLWVSLYPFGMGVAWVIRGFLRE